MIYTALPSAALVLSLIPAFLAVPFTPQPRAPGDSLNFDLKIWAKSSDTTLSVIPTNYEQGKTDQNLTSTSNADYTAEGTEPDYKTPEGASEQYVIIGQMHFNEVPDEAGRSVYILRNEGVETGPSKEKGVHVSPSVMHYSDSSGLTSISVLSPS